MRKIKEEETLNTLYVPLNIKTRFEIFSGFGFKELFLTIIVTVFTSPIGIITSIIKEDISYGILIIAIIMVATGMALKKNETNLSSLDMINLIYKFINSQQKFKYEYKHKGDDSN